MYPISHQKYQQSIGKTGLEVEASLQTTGLDYKDLIQIFPCPDVGCQESK